MPPIKKSVSDQNPALAELSSPNEESAKIEAGVNPSITAPTSMKEAVMGAVGKRPPPPPQRPAPKSMREATGRVMEKKKLRPFQKKK